MPENFYDSENFVDLTVPLSNALRDIYEIFTMVYVPE